MLSYTQISLFEKCPMKWYRKYVLQEHEPESPVLKFGSVLHNTLELFSWGCDLDAALRDNEKDLPQDQWRSLRSLVNLAVTTVENEFGIRLSNQNMSSFPFANNGVEEELVYNGFKGIIDLILSVQDKLYILDWKTTSQDYTEHQIRSSEQLICYSWLLNRVHKYTPDKVFYVTLNKKTDTCKLYSTVVSEEEINQWEQKVESIKVSIENQVNYKNPNSCEEYWGRCFYYDRCWSGKKVDLPSSAIVPKFGGK